MCVIKGLLWARIGLVRSVLKEHWKAGVIFAMLGTKRNVLCVPKGFIKIKMESVKKEELQSMIITTTITIMAIKWTIRVESVFGIFIQ